MHNGTGTGMGGTGTGMGGSGIALSRIVDRNIYKTNLKWFCSMPK